MTVTNVLLVLLGPFVIVGVIYGLAAMTHDEKQAKTIARVGELQVKAAERERKGVSR